METDEDGELINAEVFLQGLLAIAGDKDRREKVTRKISETTDKSPEMVEEILYAAIAFLANQSRSN